MELKATRASAIGNLENLTIIQPHQIVDAAEKIIKNGGLD